MGLCPFLLVLLLSVKFGCSVDSCTIDCISNLDGIEEDACKSGCNFKELSSGNDDSCLQSCEDKYSDISLIKLCQKPCSTAISDNSLNSIMSFVMNQMNDMVGQERLPDENPKIILRRVRIFVKPNNEQEPDIGHTVAPQEPDLDDEAQSLDAVKARMNNFHHHLSCLLRKLQSKPIMMSLVFLSILLFVLLILQLGLCITAMRFRRRAARLAPSTFVDGKPPPYGELQAGSLPDKVPLDV